jgi:3-deoxy-alpha-D-manno-octulosonate 8-oxidase
MKEFRIFKQVPKIIFGKNSISRISELLPPRSFGDYVIYIVDDFFKNSSIMDSFNVALEDCIEWFPASIHEPSTQQVDDLKIKLLSDKGSKLPISIIGIGGGSTMDVAKAVSVMLTNPGSASDYQGWDLVVNQGIHKVGIPTVSGSGSEASRTAVLMGKERKFGINSDYSMFDAIILDSNFLDSVPKEQGFYSGMDCYIHCVESLTGTMINELSRGNAKIALELCEKYFKGNGLEDELMAASYFGGVSIVNSEVGVCHALSYGLSMELGYRHGLANCIAFNVLDSFYGPYVENFREFLQKAEVTLPKNICRGLTSDQMGRMVSMTLKMERPLINALGLDWKRRFNEQNIVDLYLSM